MALAMLLVVAAPLIDGPSTDTFIAFALIVALGWIPASLLVSWLGRRWPGAGADLAALILDLALLVLIQVMLQPATIVLLAGLVVPVSTATYVRGRWLGAVGALGGAAAVAGIALTGNDVGNDVDGFSLVVYPVLLGTVAWLLDAVATERWQASSGLVRLDERSGAILTGIGEAVVVTGPDGRIDQWNRAASETFACDADAARGHGCHEVLGLQHGVQQLDCSSGCALRRLADHEAGVDVEVWRRLPTGSRQPLLASVAPVFDDHGDVVEVVHSFRDITRLKQADEAKTLFLATASHELKTPLTVIRGFAQMLLLPDAILGEDERRAALRAIDVRAGELTSIVDRLLLSSRIDAGRIELEPVAVPVAGILRERADAFEGATGREVDLEVPDGLPDAWCDPDALTTVVDHLIDNAVKYSPAGGKVVVGAEGDEEAVVVRVTDHGIGMTSAQAARCFERFWQAETADVRRFGGTGIGLYIVRSLVEGVGGAVTVASAPGRGSSFAVRLARADRQELRDCARVG